jgi:hypothetical protein
MEETPFTISAFPRSGTRYVACILSMNGIPCTHEFYDPFSLRKVPQLTNNLVSSVITDWAKEWRYEYSTNVYLIRNPYDVANSWMTLRPQHRNRLHDWFQKWTFEDVWTASVEFGETVSEGKVYRVEDFEDKWLRIVNMLGYPDSLLKYKPLQRVNSNADHDAYGVYEIQETPEFLDIVRKYGYG